MNLLNDNDIVEDENVNKLGNLEYLISYIIYVLILFGIISILKNRGIIQIVTNLDMKIFIAL